MKFKRGQVWENPDGLLMMVINVLTYQETHHVFYVDERGFYSMFKSDDSEIINNIELHDCARL